ncbi:DUF1127 domain-containing protein [Roseibium sp. HPY-6]|uniref:DUF1127 domain-containing protein n=1 Tax=Roseibium sp. HPY-6 TaxID=3229852 RepID=UPI00338E3B06
MPKTKLRVSRLAVWLGTFRTWRKQRRDRRELEGLSTATLRDLAIDRSEITSIVSSGQGERKRNRGD